MKRPRGFGVPSWAVLAVSAVALLSAAVVQHATGAAGAGDRAASGGTPNVLVISVCSIRPDHTSLHGYHRSTTPNLERLAADAVVFEHAVTPWPKTTPAFAALVTGRYGHDTGVMRVTAGQRLDDAHTTLAELLQARGFDTAAFISTSALNSGTNVFQQGFSRVDETYRQKDPFGETTRRALDWIGRSRQAPFLAWVHYNNAHQPYTAPGAPRDLFIGDRFYDPSLQVPLNDGKPLDLPVAPDHPHRPQILRPDMGGVRPEAQLAARPAEMAFYVARYDAGIFGADRMIGHLLDGLRERGLLDRTIIAVVGDHGEALGDHDYYFGHGRLPYDASARVPLLIRPAGGTSGRRVVRPVSSLGLAPTLLSMVGAPVPSEMAWPPLLGGRALPEHVFSEAGYSLDYPLTVRDGRWKLIYVPNPVDRSLMRGREFELYDLRTDPGETRDLYRPDLPAARSLRRALLLWSRGWIRDAYSTTSKRHGIIDQETLDQLRALGYLN